ncbi:MAG: hypothetical protein ACE5KG_03340 [Nitrososphaerales archaeon]
MTIYETTKLLWELARPAPYRNQKLIDEFRSNPKDVLARYELTAEESEAIAKGDVGALFRIGVHPRIMYRAARFYGVKTAEEYKDRIAGISE